MISSPASSNGERIQNPAYRLSGNNLWLDHGTNRGHPYLATGLIIQSLIYFGISELIKLSRHMSKRYFLEMRY